MTSKPTSKNNNTIDFKSCIGIAIGAFFIGTILIGVVGLLLVSIIAPDCWESCPLMVITMSPWIGGLIAIVAGIVGGQKAYNNKESYLRNSKKVKARDTKSHDSEGTARVLHGFLKLNSFCSECGIKVLSQNAEHCPNCKRKFV